MEVQNMLKKIIQSIFMLALITFSFSATSTSTLANETNSVNLKKQYAVLVNSGMIDSSVDYQTWAEMYSRDLEAVEAIKAEMKDEVHQNITTVSPAYTQMKAGDVFVTTSTALGGLIGHSGIAIDGTYILHTPGGSGSTSERITFDQWKNRYKDNGSKTWILRHPSASTATKAADWAKKNYWSTSGGSIRNIKPSYSITTDLYSKDPTYCSKLVWQSFYYTDSSTVRVPGASVLSPLSLQPGVLGTLWKGDKPTVISTVSNY